MTSIYAIIYLAGFWATYILLKKIFKESETTTSDLDVMKTGILVFAAWCLWSFLFFATIISIEILKAQ